MASDYIHLTKHLRRKRFTINEAEFSIFELGISITRSAPYCVASGWHVYIGVHYGGVHLETDAMPFLMRFLTYCVKSDKLLTNPMIESVRMQIWTQPFRKWALFHEEVMAKLVDKRAYRDYEIGRLWNDYNFRSMIWSTAKGNGPVLDATKWTVYSGMGSWEARLK